jgi:cysteine desulfurase
MIYLDYNASTPVDERVLSTMLPYFSEVYGNPSNGYHWQGRKAARAIESARGAIASLIGAQASEIIFTSGATESNNLAILGFARASKGIERHNRTRIVISSVEHKAVIQPAKTLSAEGFEVVFLPVDNRGIVKVEEAEKLIDDRTLMVSIQAANNETGVIHPIPELIDIAHQHGAIFHCDAAQAVGRIPVDVKAWDVDLLSLSGHKFYGPKGIGALYLKGGQFRSTFEPLCFGGNQEKGTRPGTENVPAIVGLGEASRLAQELLEEERQSIQQLRDMMEERLLEQLPSASVNGAGAKRLPNTINITIPKVPADVLLLNLPEVMMGTGSACSSGTPSPSHVLLSMGLNSELASATVRISLGRFTSEEEIERAINLIILAVEKLS